MNRKMDVMNVHDKTHKNIVINVHLYKFFTYLDINVC